MPIFSFEWDAAKDLANQAKHGVAFLMAQRAFLDSDRVVVADLRHSEIEQRYYCIGKIDTDIITVRFTLRNGVIRIIGAGYWRKGKAIYERQNPLHERAARQARNSQRLFAGAR